MKKTLRILITLLILTSFSCKSQSKSENEMTEFSKETTEKGTYNRFVLVKGKNLKNIQPKIQEWAEIFGAGEPVNLTINKTDFGSWTLINLPENELLNAYNYHNLVYWFLGTPPEDQNYADYSIGISIDKNGESTYLIFNDYDLREKIATNDDVFGISEKNQKFILSIPFDELKASNDKEILDFNQFLTESGINLNEIKADKLNWTELKINVK
ncbi:MAG: hypothetical protein GX793_04045 [Bacteroidales bacterium]|jgi:hypothetical protein|nr:hypothetical protein [Bacteroidales bacterium]